LKTEDADLLINSINIFLEKIPNFVKNTINSYNIITFINIIPDNFRKYTLGEILNCIEESIKSGKIKL